VAVCALFEGVRGQGTFYHDLFAVQPNASSGPGTGSNYLIGFSVVSIKEDEGKDPGSSCWVRLCGP